MRPWLQPTSKCLQQPGLLVAIGLLKDSLLCFNPFLIMCNIDITLLALFYEYDGAQWMLYYVYYYVMV